MLGFAPLASSPLAAIGGTAIAAQLGVQVGAYTLSGQNVSLLFVRKLPAEAAAYVVSGQVVELILSISQEALYRTLLVGSSAHQVSGYKMIQNFTMIAGDYKTLVISIKDANGTAVNISTATALKWQCARSYGKASDISKSLNSGITISDGANGVCVVELDEEDTEDLRGTFIHELEMTLGGITSTPIVGTMKVNPSLIESTAT